MPDKTIGKLKTTTEYYGLLNLTFLRTLNRNFFKFVAFWVYQQCRGLGTFSQKPETRNQKPETRKTRPP